MMRILGRLLYFVLMNFNIIAVFVQHLCGAHDEFCCLPDATRCSCIDEVIGRRA